MNWWKIDSNFEPIFDKITIEDPSNYLICVNFIIKTATGDEAIPARAYLGCYPDNDTDYRILKGSIREFSDNTPSKCHKICYQQGFRFFGLSDV